MDAEENLLAAKLRGSFEYMRGTRDETGESIDEAVDCAGSGFDTPMLRDGRAGTSIGIGFARWRRRC